MEIFYDQSQILSVSKVFNGVLDNGNSFTIVGTYDSMQWFVESIMFDVYSDKNKEVEDNIIRKFEEEMNINNNKNN